MLPCASGCTVRCSVSHFTPVKNSTPVWSWTPWPCVWRRHTKAIEPNTAGVNFLIFCTSSCNTVWKPCTSFYMLAGFVKQLDDAWLRHVLWLFVTVLFHVAKSIHRVLHAVPSMSCSKAGLLRLSGLSDLHLLCVYCSTVVLAMSVQKLPCVLNMQLYASASALHQKESIYVRSEMRFFTDGHC